MSLRHPRGPDARAQVRREMQAVVDAVVAGVDRYRVDPASAVKVAAGELMPLVARAGEDAATRLGLAETSQQLIAAARTAVGDLSDQAHRLHMALLGIIVPLVSDVAAANGMSAAEMLAPLMGQES